jgi:putative transcriptional regulator
MKHMKELRKQAGYKTVTPAAKALGISSTLLYAIEEDIRRPSLNVSFKMIGVYKCTLDDIFLPYITTNCNN